MRFKHKFYKIFDRQNPEKWSQLSFKDAARICEVNIKTVGRWASGSQKPHPSAYRLL